MAVSLGVRTTMRMRMAVSFMRTRIMRHRGRMRAMALGLQTDKSLEEITSKIVPTASLRDSGSSEREIRATAKAVLIGKLKKERGR